MSIFHTDTASIEILSVTNLTVQTSSIQYFTSSQFDVGTNFITLNTTAPLRYGGIAVADSGSSPIVSGSLLFDSQNNQWIYIHQTTPGSAITSSVLIMGPQTFNNVGNEITITANRLTKGQAGDLGEYITSSNVTDTGTLVSINSNTEVTGSFIVTSGITGSLLGTAQTASYVQTAQTASYISGTNVDGNITGNANNITAYTINQNLGTTNQVTFAGITASLQGTATTASYVVTAQTASYVQTAQTASYVLQAVSSSFASTASFALSGNGSFSGSFSGSYVGNGSALTGISAVAAPAGPNKSVQFNDNGTTSGSSNLTFDKTTNQLILTGSLLITGSVNATIFTNTLKISGSSGAAGDYITTQFLGADVSNSTTGLVTAMTTTGVGPGLYQFKYVVRYQSAATTTGIGLAVDHTQASNYFVSSFWFVSTGGTAATGVADQVSATTAGQMVEGKSERVKGTVTSTTTGVDTQNADMLAVMEGLIDVSTSGDLILEFRSEVAASQVTIKSGTSLILTKMW